MSAGCEYAIEQLCEVVCVEGMKDSRTKLEGEVQALGMGRDEHIGAEHRARLYDLSSLHNYHLSTREL